MNGPGVEQEAPVARAARTETPKKGFMSPLRRTGAATPNRKQSIGPMGSTGKKRSSASDFKKKTPAKNANESGLFGRFGSGMANMSQNIRKSLGGGGESKTIKPSQLRGRSSHLNGSTVESTQLSDASTLSGSTGPFESSILDFSFAGSSARASVGAISSTGERLSASGILDADLPANLDRMSSASEIEPRDSSASFRIDASVLSDTSAGSKFVVRRAPLAHQQQQLNMRELMVENTSLQSENGALRTQIKELRRGSVGGDGDGAGDGHGGASPGFQEEGAPLPSCLPLQILSCSLPPARASPGLPATAHPTLFRILAVTTHPTLFRYRGTSLIRNCTPPGSCSSSMPRALW
jgi:hypothetical protein